MSQTATATQTTGAGRSTYQKITPFLWFDTQAEEAANFYVSIFKNSRIRAVTHYSEAVSEAANRPVGSVMTVDFELDGQEFIALNGGPTFKFTEAVSLFVRCDTQAEIDELSEKLIAGGGEQSYCGWLKDKFGLSWQIIPAAFDRMVNDPDRSKGERVTAAIMGMKKIDLPTLERAFAGS
jgi:predicted 3-demethylubiquinone-9 3-methyltransferase (glyoxalase superfamily)